MESRLIVGLYVKGGQAVAYLEIRKGEGYISGVHFQSVQNLAYKTFRI